MSLYKLVNSVISSSNEESAKKILIDSNLLLLNNSEYYSAIVANFIQKKEIIIKRVNGNLLFDLNNTNDIWNIIFISEYIKENDVLYKTYNSLLLEIANIESQLLTIKSKHKNAKSKEEHESINREYQKINNVLSSRKNQRDSMSKILETFYETDWIKLLNTNDKIDQMKEAYLLKQAINIIHKVRNSLEHENIEINNMIEIDNDHFKISIPIEYLDGFSKGRIIAKNKDKIIVERTNSIALPLLDELNCDINSIQSLFYNLEPEFLSLLLEKYNYNVKSIYKLSKGILENSKKTKELLKNGVSIEIIEKIPLLISDDSIRTKQIIYLIELLKKFNLLDKMGVINTYALKNVDVLEMYLENGIDIDIINSFEYAAFVNPSYAKKLVKKINLLKENGIDFAKLIERFSNNRDANRIPFEYADEIIMFSEILKKNNIPIEVLCDEELLKIELFKNKDKFAEIFKDNNILITLIRPIYWYMASTDGKSFDSGNRIVDELVKNGINYDDIGFYGSDFEKLKTVLINNKLYPMNSNNNTVYIIIEFLRIMETLDKQGAFYENISIFDKVSYLVNNGVDIEKIDSISIDAIANAEKTLLLINHGFSFEEIKKIPQFGYRYIDETMELINYLKENNLSFELLNIQLWDRPLNAIKLLKTIPTNKIDIVKNISQLSISDIDSSILIINKLIEYNVDINKVPTNFLEGAKESVSLIAWLESKKYDMKILERLPATAFFRFNESDFYMNALLYPKSMLKKYIDLPRNGSKYLDQTEFLIECFFENAYTSDKELPQKVFSVTNVNKQNIEYLLKIINYEYKKLDEFPLEFYTCNFDMLENMCKHYNYNLCKSIFGIGNSKLITALIYGNSVLRQYQKENNDDVFIDIDPIRVIHAGFNTSLMYMDNFNQEIYLDRFIRDDDGNIRNNDEIKKYALDKLRNSCAHFRFKPLLDKDGKIIDDKIYIYDKYDAGSMTNFDIVLDIKDFIEIIRQVEMGLLKKENKFSTDEEVNRFRKR